MTECTKGKELVIHRRQFFSRIRLRVVMLTMSENGGKCVCISLVIVVNMFLIGYHDLVTQNKWNIQHVWDEEIIGIGDKNISEFANICI